MRLRLGVHQPRQGVVGTIGLAGQRLDGELQSPRACGTDVEQHVLRLRSAIGAENDRMRGQQLAGIPDRQTRVAATEPVLLKLHDGTQAGACERACRDDHVLDLDVLVDCLRAKPDGIDRYPAVAQSLDDAAIDAPGVVAAVAEQYDGPQGQIGGLGDELFQTRTNVCRRRDGWPERLRIRDARHSGIETIQACLELALQVSQHACLKSADGALLTRRSVLLQAHAARVVDENRDDVLARLQLRDCESGPPKQHPQHRDRHGLESPDHAQTPPAHAVDRA